jgi:hypothetical protein
MVDSYLQTASILVLAWLFGGMLLFSAGFAAFLFKYLPPADARMLIRKAFPPFYLFVILSSGLVAVLSFRSDWFTAASMALVALTTLAARQFLMPAINQATDLGLKKRFVYLHGFSVLLTLGHIVLSAVVLVHMVH